MWEYGILHHCRARAHRAPKSSPRCSSVCGFRYANCFHCLCMCHLRFPPTSFIQRKRDKTRFLCSLKLAKLSLKSAKAVQSLYPLFSGLLMAVSSPLLPRHLIQLKPCTGFKHTYMGGKLIRVRACCSNSVPFRGKVDHQLASK